VDFPDDANFLNPLEKYVIISRLKSDGQASWRGESLKWKSIVAAFQDWKLYMGILTNAGVTVPTYALALFFPSIIKELGYTTLVAQLLTVPPFALAAFMVFIIPLEY
jgi:hypothetical protein